MMKRNIEERRLGFYETLCYELSKPFHGTSQIVLICRVRGPFTPEIFRRSWSVIYDRHPQLRARIDTLGEEPRLVTDVPIERIHLDTEERGERIGPGQCMENELDTMSPPEQYLW